MTAASSPGGPLLLDEAEIARRVADMDGWSYDDGRLVLSVEASTFSAGIRLVDAVAAVSDEIDHHPDIDVRWTTVTFRLWTHVSGGVTARDFRLADHIRRLASEQQR